MFVHGREAYRRNSFLVLYTFYKNVLYISTQWYFGFWSAFSGQPLYEPFIYQLYNVTMTSFPIMYFACFDFEYLKDEFLERPLLYKIGLNHECYSVKNFLQYVLYGLWHASILYLTGYQALLKSGQTMDDGKEFGIDVAGNHVYVVCILVANYIVVQRCNNYTGFGEMLTALMCFAAFFFMYVQSAFDMKFPQLYLIFGPMYTQSSIWVSMFLGIIQAWVFEFFVSRFSTLISPHLDWKKWSFKGNDFEELGEESSKNEGGNVSEVNQD